eukprot:CAMPEP_0181174614 /NCGR_PEP_ID=MMETSP1096-20121128/3637_1 /TAXON_ID=156174 ORGANISM="Chrysochromulina ericina, Strain CCMP281" /NCGR_SAMPLE_ID=MMETSP1096 /ASSEMBLY_ACC=CAM_ASM_000453 /LENGTH=153 /DNA_ID=CAMNT_0023262541 /DNA_START=953 /DNA_END=1415 /DNA_ORIENTATION=-
MIDGEAILAEVDHLRSAGAATLLRERGEQPAEHGHSDGRQTAQLKQQARPSLDLTRSSTSRAVPTRNGSLLPSASRDCTIATTALAVASVPPLTWSNTISSTLKCLSSAPPNARTSPCAPKAATEAHHSPQAHGAGKLCGQLPLEIASAVRNS